MKLAVIAAALLVLTTSRPVTAANSDARWDCGNGIGVSAGKGELGIGFEYMPYAPKVEPSEREVYRRNKGSRTFHLEWNFRNGKAEVRVNGKLCK